MKLAHDPKFSPASGINMDLVWEAEAARLRGGVERRGLRHRCGVAGRLGVGADHEDQGRDQHHADAGAHPACAAMTAMTLQALSGNRFLCGIGPSGPQVVEGWHGVPFGKPLLRTREYIAIIRQIVERQAPLEFRRRALSDSLYRAGCHRARQAAQEHHSRRPESEDLHRGDRAGRAADRGRGRRRHLADLHVARKAEAITAPILEGIAKAGGGKTLANFDIAPYVRIAWAMTSPPAATRSGRISRSTSAAWAPDRRTTTTI